jgi:simple sugar transport system ATP-binding protein
LTVEQRQLVEIARALSFGARFIILDEPTARLDAAAIRRLFERIRALQGQGVTFLYISHHLQEIYEICDTVTVLRDARLILTAPVAGVSRQDLVAAMTGESGYLAQAVDGSPVPVDAPTVLDVQDLVVSGVPGNVSFSIQACEIVGLAGAGGSGKVEVGETLVGLRRPVSGRIVVSGRPLRPGSVADSLAAGVAWVPQDRHRQGFVPLLSIAENVTMTVPQRVRRFGLLAPGKRDAAANRLIGKLAIKTPGPDVAVAGLSGGNQQKVVMARALASDPQLLVLIAPTAGIDVRSKQTLLGTIEDARVAGTAVLIVSDELDDLRACDRVLVMFRGRVTQEVARGWNDNDLVAAMEGVDLDHV